VRVEIGQPTLVEHWPDLGGLIDMEKLLERVVVDPNILAEKPVIRGTRIPVYFRVWVKKAPMLCMGDEFTHHQSYEISSPT